MTCNLKCSYYKNKKCYKKICIFRTPDNFCKTKFINCPYKDEECKTCLYENNLKDDNTCGMCNPNTPQSYWTPKINRGKKINDITRISH